MYTRLALVKAVDYGVDLLKEFLILAKFVNFS